MRSGPLCALLWRIMTWCTKNQVTLRARHIPGRLNVVAVKLSRLGQIIQTEWSLHPQIFSDNLQQVAPTPDRSVCNKIQQQINPVCITSARSSGLGSRCTQPVLGKSGPICLPTDRHFGQSGGKATKRTVQEAHSGCSRVAKHALVLGSSDHVQSNSTVSAQSADTALQSDASQESGQPKSPCMAPRASAIKEQGFSEAVAARIEAPQRRSTRSVYEAKWTIFTKWCISHKVDFRATPVKSVADFLMYLGPRWQSGNTLASHL